MTRRVVVLSIDEELEEMRALLDTLRFVIVKEFIQNRARPHPVSFFGPGKIDDIHAEVEDLEFDHVIINGLLKPSQHHFLEMKFQKECLDRTGVILRIFSDHAQTPEAIAQVTLARLKYEQPFLREWIHKAKSGERPGFLSGGAYATDVYYEHARTQTRRIEERLIEISKEKENRRMGRRLKGYTLVALAGYTNAGKSSLMNALCGSDVTVDDKLFSTLSTTTRKIRGLSGRVLVTDTVGFITDLPTDLINAFNATLQEVYEADLILLVLDVSENPKRISEKFDTSISILNKRTADAEVVVVGNKVDKVPAVSRGELVIFLRSMAPSWDVILTSAKTSEGFLELKSRIALSQRRSYEIIAQLPVTDESLSLISRLHGMAALQQVVKSDSIELKVMCAENDAQKIEGWIRAAGGRLNSQKDEGPRA